MFKQLLPLIIAVLIGLIAFANAMDSNATTMPKLIFAAEFTLRGVGSAAAVMGLLVLLWQWSSNAALSAFVPSAVVILAGIVVSSQFWASALAFAVVTASIVVVTRTRQLPPAPSDPADAP